MHEVRAREGPHAGRLRLRESRRRARCSSARRPASTRTSRACRSSGQAGKLLDRLLEGIGLDARRRLRRERPQVPASRQPRPAAGGDRRVRAAPLPADRAHRADARRDARELRDEAPVGPPAGITRVHGQAQEVTLGARRVQLYPIYHPAAALYTPSMLKVLEEDFARIPQLLDVALVEAGRGARSPSPSRPRSRSRFSSGSSSSPARPVPAR